MKVLRILLLAFILAISNPMMTANAEKAFPDSPLLPGTKVVAGDPNKDEFFIVADNDVMKVKQPVIETISDEAGKTQSSIRVATNKPLANKAPEVKLPPRPISHNVPLTQQVVQSQLAQSKTPSLIDFVLRKVIPAKPAAKEVELSKSPQKAPSFASKALVGKIPVPYKATESIDIALNESSTAALDVISAHNQAALAKSPSSMKKALHKTDKSFARMQGKTQPKTPVVVSKVVVRKLPVPRKAAESIDVALYESSMDAPSFMRVAHNTHHPIPSSRALQTPLHQKEADKRLGTMHSKAQPKAPLAKKVMMRKMVVPHRAAESINIALYESSVSTGPHFVKVAKEKTATPKSSLAIERALYKPIESKRFVAMQREHKNVYKPIAQKQRVNRDADGYKPAVSKTSVAMKQTFSKTAITPQPTHVASNAVSPAKAFVPVDKVADPSQLKKTAREIDIAFNEANAPKIPIAKKMDGNKAVTHKPPAAFTHIDRAFKKAIAHKGPTQTQMDVDESDEQNMFVPTDVAHTKLVERTARAPKHSVERKPVMYKKPKQTRIALHPINKYRNTVNKHVVPRKSIAYKAPNKATFKQQPYRKERMHMAFDQSSDLPVTSKKRIYKLKRELHDVTKNGVSKTLLPTKTAYNRVPQKELAKKKVFVPKIVMYKPAKPVFKVYKPYEVEAKTKPYLASAKQGKKQSRKVASNKRAVKTKVALR